MKAQVLKNFGPHAQFELMDIAKPLMKPGHLLIKVIASSINQLDAKIREGQVPEVSPDLPAVLQGDVAGVVEAVAEDVTNFKKGDAVFGYAGGLKDLSGALSEYMLVDARLVALKPESLSFHEAAALPLVGITAWDALFTKANLQAGQSILIHGGVGGVGHIALQLAKNAGAKITTTVLNDDDITLAHQLGADYVINARHETPAEYVARVTQSKGFDIVFDTVGGANLQNSFQAAKINGTIVTTAARSTQDLSLMHNKALTLHAVFITLPLLNNKGREKHGEIMKHLSHHIQQGQLKPLLDSQQFLSNAVNEAYAYLASGKARGKVVISIYEEGKHDA